MNIQKKLSRLGIEKIEELDKKDVNYLAHYMANCMTNTFLTMQDYYNEILAKLLNCTMYYAKISGNVAKVNYIYEDNCIYIDENINIYEPNEELFHELIHYLQVFRKNNGKIKHIGLCNFGDFSVKGLGLNEALVQYMSASLMKKEKQRTRIYGLELKTISPDAYPVLTNLIEQLVYLIGEDEILLASINAKNNFDDVFYNTFEEKGNQIIKAFDKILDLKNKLLEAKEGIYKKETPQEIEASICYMYVNTQKIMLTKYFDKMVTMLTSIQEIDFYIEKFLNFNKILGILEKNREEVLDFYEEYKDEIMKKFDKRLMKLSKDKGRNTLSEYNNILGRFIKRAFHKSSF